LVARAARFWDRQKPWPASADAAEDGFAQAIEAIASHYEQIRTQRTGTVQ